MADIWLASSASSTSSSSDSEENEPLAKRRTSLQAKPPSAAATRTATTASARTASSTTAAVASATAPKTAATAPAAVRQRSTPIHAMISDASLDADNGRSRPAEPDEVCSSSVAGAVEAENYSPAALGSSSEAQIPPGWTLERRTTPSGRCYCKLLGPDGKKAQSFAEAWRKAASDEGPRQRRKLTEAERGLNRASAPSSSSRVSIQSSASATARLPTAAEVRSCLDEAEGTPTQKEIRQRLEKRQSLPVDGLRQFKDHIKRLLVQVCGQEGIEVATAQEVREEERLEACHAEASERAREGVARCCGVCSYENEVGALQCCACDALLPEAVQCTSCTLVSSATRTLCEACEAPLILGDPGAEERVCELLHAAGHTGQGQLVLSEAPRTCPVCTYEKRLVLLRHCAHAVCEACMRVWAGEQRSKGEHTPSCPLCQRELLPRDATALLDEASLSRFETTQLEQAAAEGKDIVRCPSADCTGMVAWDASGTRAAGRAWECDVCQKSCCLRCRAQPYHQGHTCEEHAVSGAEAARREAERKTFELMDAEGYQKCKCGARIEKVSGCNKMMCRVCKHRWCWRCGAVDAACRCTAASHGFLDNATGKVVSQRAVIAQSKRKRD